MISNALAIELTRQVRDAAERVSRMATSLASVRFNITVLWINITAIWAFFTLHFFNII